MRSGKEGRGSDEGEDILECTCLSSVCVCDKRYIQYIYTQLVPHIQWPRTYVHTCHGDTLYLDPQTILVDVSRHGGDPRKAEVKHWDGVAQLLNPARTQQPHKQHTSNGQEDTDASKQADTLGMAWYWCLGSIGTVW